MENEMTAREMLVDLINDLGVRIEILNAEMALREQAGRDGSAEYEALSATEWKLCEARAAARRELRHLA